MFIGALNVAPFLRMRRSGEQKRETISTSSGVNKSSRAYVLCANFWKSTMLDNDSESEKSEERVVEPEFANPDMQKARAFLRERFLRVVTGIVGNIFES